VWPRVFAPLLEGLSTTDVLPDESIACAGATSSARQIEYK
jgi:hypothetical protein